MVRNLDVVNAFLRQRNSKTLNNEAIKWSISSRAYDVHVRILTSIAMEELIPHCILVRRKVTTVVNNKPDLGTSLF